MAECIDPNDIPRGAGGPGLQQTADQIDVEFLCDETTDTWFQVLFINGVEQSRTDTTTPCSEPPPTQAQIDVERICIGGFTNWVTFTDGVITSTVPTVEPCSQDENVDFEHVCMVDDTAGNGDPNDFVTFYRWQRREVSDAGVLTVTNLGDFVDTDNTATYDLGGRTPVTCCEAAQLGNAASAFVAAGETYPAGTVRQPQPETTWIDSLTVTAVGGDVSFVDSFGHTSYVRSGQSKTWTSHFPLPLTAPTFTVPAGAELDVAWVEPTF